jgi:hypothetical protein
VAAGNGKRNGNGNGEMASHTLRLLREMRAHMAKMATKDDLTRSLDGLATKTDLAKVESRLDSRIESLEHRLGRRIDVLRDVFKENHRVFTKRLRTVENRVGLSRR